MKKLICILATLCACALLAACTSVQDAPAPVVPSAGGEGGPSLPQPVEGQYEEYERELAALEALIDDLALRVNEAEPPADETQAGQDYFALHGEAEELENNLESLEMLMEGAYSEGLLSWDEFSALDQYAEKLETKLDGIEDVLERVYRMDD